MASQIPDFLYSYVLNSSVSNNVGPQLDLLRVDFRARQPDPSPAWTCSREAGLGHLPTLVEQRG
jgi:hypothetical protein